jgi:hypothetical protein
VKELLSAILGPLDALLGAIPFGAARWVIVGFLALAGLIPQLLPRDYVYLGAPDRERWRDLRLWAAVIVGVYVLIYATL